MHRRPMFLHMIPSRHGITIVSLLALFRKSRTPCQAICADAKIQKGWVYFRENVHATNDQSKGALCPTNVGRVFGFVLLRTRTQLSTEPGLGSPLS